MHEASSPPIRLQVQATSTLAIDAQDVQESKLEGFIRSAYEALQAMYAGLWLNKELGYKYFVVSMQLRYILGEYKMDLGLV